MSFFTTLVKRLLVRSLTRGDAPFEVQARLQHVGPVVHRPVVKLDQDVPPCGEIVVVSFIGIGPAFVIRTNVYHMVCLGANKDDSNHSWTWFYLRFASGNWGANGVGRIEPDCYPAHLVHAGDVKVALGTVPCETLSIRRIREGTGRMASP